MVRTRPWYAAPGMRDATDLIPMRWPPGWRDPSYLDLVEETPINCLLFAAPPPGELLAAARARNLDCFKEAGGAEARPWSEHVRVMPRWKLDCGRAEPILAAGECVWPSLAQEAGGVRAGPTGVPWVDSNGWFIQLVRARAPGKALWIFCEPPEKTVLGPESYALAVADAEAHGARWAITLDSASAADRARAARALAAVGAAVKFFQAHRAWRAFAPRGIVGVLSDFAEPNQELAEEILNLLSRRWLPFRVLMKSDAPPSLRGLKAVIYPDQGPPEPVLRERLLGFVRAGGLLIVGPHWPAREGSPGPGDVYGRFDVLHAGKGRLAVAREPLTDPYLVALDTHLLLSHRHDLLRLWNGGSLNAYYTEAPGGKLRLVQLLNYAARRAAHPVTLGLADSFRVARFWELGAEGPRALQWRKAANNVELPLPEFAVYAAIELEG